MPKQKQEAEPMGEVDIVRTGEQIVIPENMEYDEAIKWLHRRAEEEETVVSVTETIDAWPMDGAVCFARVLKERYGWTGLVPTPGFWGDQPPKMVGVPIGPNETVQVPWGRFVVPNIEGNLNCGFSEKEGRPLFRLHGEVKRKHESILHEIADAVRREVKAGSIYRGKPIAMTFRDKDGERREKFNIDEGPTFIDVSKVQPEILVFPEATENAIQTNLFTPVKYSDRCRASKVPLKRGVLLEGPYGTGKTLTAYVLAHLCAQHGWTFLYLQDVRDLDLALAFAKLYEPTVVFAEDVDRVVRSRDTEMNKILNSIDGVDSKEHELMVVLTTNDINSIHPAFVRPGRIDAVVSIQPPDEKATIRLIRQYGGDRIEATDEELTTAVEPLIGHNAAVIREAVERSKLAACRRSDEGMINADDIRVSGETMGLHLALLSPNHDGKGEMSHSEAAMQETTAGVVENLAAGRLPKRFLKKIKSGVVKELTGG